jgi:phosphohistidine swiveling domain-containing protein
VKLVSGAPKLTFQELESIMGLSERIRTAGFPALEVDVSVNGKVTGAAAKTFHSVVFPHGKSDELVGLPASSGKVKAECLVLPSQENISGKIIVLKSSKDLLLLIRQKPAGIILEEGNLLSHASILAREAKIPAIVKVKDATLILKSGDVIEIDASIGTIKKS